MDSLIALATTLFILSMINERIVNFIKLQYSGRRFFGIPMGNLKDDMTNDDAEDLRTKKIIAINIVFGTLVAICMRADLITIMNHMDRPSDGIGWDVKPANWYLTLLPGCFLTGCFLSLGSKFWHDLLDVLMQVKDYKKALVDSQVQSNNISAATYLTQKTAPPTSANLHYQPSGLTTAQLAIQNNHADLLFHYNNINKLMPAFQYEGNTRTPCIDICLTDNDTKRIPLFLNYENPDGTTASLKTRIIQNFQHVKPQVGRGQFIVNDNTPLDFGTIGCVLVGKNPTDLYVLTCNHVLTAGKFINPGSLGDQTDEILDGNSIPIGKWVAGKMNNQVDAAIVSISDPSTVASNGLDSVVIYPLKENDQGVTQVELIGAVSSQQRAFIIHLNQPMQVDYDNSTVEIDGLFTLSAGNDPNNFSPVTKKGDSGSMIFSSVTKQPVGIVLGANLQFTFGIPMSIVLAAFPNLSLSVFNN